MITDKDKKHLIKAASPKRLLGFKFVIPFIILLYLGIGILNVYLATKLAYVDGVKFPELMNSLVEGYSAKGTYTGLYCLAIERLYMAMFNFGLALFFLLLWVPKWNEFRRNQRILAYIESTKSAPIGREE